MNQFLFYYFGDDEPYFRTLSSEFSRHTRLSVEFKRFYESDEKQIQSFFLKVFQEKPACVFIDFSKNTQDYLHLARIIVRGQLEHELVTVGLVDFLSPPEVIEEALATGVDLTHIKSAEVFDVVFGAGKLVSPKEVPEHDFAKATLKDEFEAGVVAKVGYVHSAGLHLETDLPVEKGQKIRLNHHWTEKHMVPSHEAIVRGISQKNLFYHFSHAVDADFLFVDELGPLYDMESELALKKVEERENHVRYHKKLLTKWISDNVSRSLEKKAKVLVIDRDFHFYNGQARTDKHPYTIRCLGHIDDPVSELDRLEPQVLAFALEKEGPQAKNTTAKLYALLKTLKFRNQVPLPFVVVFNTKIPSKELQRTFDYPQIMCTESELSVELLVRMADVFEKKLSESLSFITEADRVFLRKSNVASLAEIVTPIRILQISETDAVFQSDRELPIGINLHLPQPVNLRFHVLMKTRPNGFEYYGLIHSLGEVQKKDLRRFVNSVFFRGHDEDAQSESEEFKKLNEAKLQEKLGQGSGKG